MTIEKRMFMLKTKKKCVHTWCNKLAMDPKTFRRFAIQPATHRSRNDL